MFQISATLIVATIGKPQYNYDRPTGFTTITGYNQQMTPSFQNINQGTNFGGSNIGVSTGASEVFGVSGVSEVQNIHRHVYVYAPPEQDEIQTQKQIISQAPAQKHYKIIFIKTPTYQTLSQAQIALQRQNEEKTLVYVLVKKPEEAEDIQIQGSAQIPPSKPEVYFIKYKAKNSVSDVSNVRSGTALAGGSLVTGAGITTGTTISSGLSTGSFSTGIPRPQYGIPFK